MREFLFFFIAVITFCSVDRPAEPPQNSVEGEIRAALCDIENGNHAAARATLEKVLQKEPQNIYAQRLLPGALAKTIKKDDRSPENVARIRLAVEAYRKFSQIPQISARDRKESDEFVVTLLKLIGDEEKTAELLKRAEDKNRTPERRAEYYSMLAYDQYYCAREVLEEGRKLEKAEIEKAKNCLSKALEFTDRAIALNDLSEKAWGAKADLLFLSARTAAFENTPKQRNALLAQANEAKEKFKEIISRNRSNEVSDPGPEPKTDKTDLETYSQELIRYKYEKPLDRLVKEVYLPLELYGLIEPVLAEEEIAEQKNEAADASDDNQKREWKPFSPQDEEFAVELPVNVRADSSPGVVIYEASSEGIKFVIFSQPKPPSEPAVSTALVLNTLAWAVVLPTRNLAMIGAANVFEVDLIRKENSGGAPRRIYAFSVGSCAGKTPGTIFVTIGKERNYAVRIIGAGEQDARAQRFLKSWKIKTGVN